MVFQYQFRHLEAYAIAQVYRLVTPVLAASRAPIIWFGLGTAGAYGLEITPDCSSALLIVPLCGLGMLLMIPRRLPVSRVAKALAVASAVLVAGNLLRIGVIAFAIRVGGIGPGYQIGHLILGSLVGILAAAAGPAAAASPNEAYGVKATGLINVAPVADATSPGTSPVTLAHINLGVLTADLVTDTADATSASSTIAHVVADLTPLVHLDARVVTSSCSFDPNTGTVSGTSSILGGDIAGLVSLPLLTNPAPNTMITVPGIADITLNRQTVAPDGTLTVDAVYVSLLRRAQTITLATSVCNDASLAPVPVLPGMALPIGLGAIALLGLGGLGYQVSRRRRAASEA